MTFRPLLAVSALAASGLLLAGCTSGSAGASDEGSVQVVASTNVYGQLAEQIGGDRVEVTSIVTSASQDPHSYEATARDQLTLQRADLVIENGGGYDAFVDTLLEGLDEDPAVITAVEFSHDWPDNEGHEAETTEGAAEEPEADAHADAHAEDHTDEPATEAPTDEPTTDEPATDDHDHADHGHVEGFNEHVWYDVHTMVHVVEAIATELAELDPDGAAEFDAAATELVAELETIEGHLDDLAGAHEGAGVFLTEPVPGYLASAAGLTDVAPEGFAASVEEGRDVAPATLLEALTVVDSGDVRAVLSNSQTGGSETTRVEEAAEAAGIPIVRFAELLPADTSYAEWMTDNVARLAAALDS